MGMDIKKAFTEVLSGLNTHVYQPMVKKIGAFKRHVVRILARVAPTSGLRSGTGVGGSRRTPLGSRSVTLEVPEVRELTQKQKERLDDWVKQASNDAGRHRRSQAVERIVTAACSGSNEISFASLYLDELPDDVLAEMPFITKLDCSNCYLRQMPLCFKKLPLLQELNLSGVSYVDQWSLSQTPLKSLKKLTLNRAALTDVPRLITQCPNLTHLSMQGNYLRTIPDLPPHLGALNLDYNFIDQIPDSLARNRKHSCVVMLDFNRLSTEQVRSRVKLLKKNITFWNGRNELLSDTAKTVISHTGRVRVSETKEWGSDDFLKHWFQVGDRSLPEGLLEKFEDDETIKLFLSKMISSADYLNRDGYGHLAGRICTLLEEMHHDAEIFEACHELINDATETCEDRASIGLSETELAIKAVKAKREGLEAVIKLGEACYLKTLVDDMALKHLGTLSIGGRDDVETILFFEIYFAQKFDLPIEGKQKMRYISCANTSQEDLDRAETEILSVLSKRTQDDRCSFFSRWKPWREYLKETPNFEEANQKINGEYSEKIDALNFDPMMRDRIHTEEEIKQYNTLLGERERASEELYQKETERVLPTQG